MRTSLHIVAGWVAAIVLAATAARGQLPMPEPAKIFTQHHTLSPDGRTLVFSYAGDLWSVSSTGGGLATRLTSHPALELRSAFSPDGTKLAFESTRDGARNLYIAEVAGGNGSRLVLSTPRRVTNSDSNQTLSGFTADGGSLVFDSFRERAIHRHPRVYAAPVDGGPITRLTDAYAHTARVAAGGGVMTFTRGWSSWDRPVYRGPGARDVWAMDPEDGSFTQLTFNEANDGNAFPARDGSVVFVSSRDGQNNLYRLPAGATDRDADPVQFTSYEPEDVVSVGHGVRDVAVDAGGRFAVYAVWDRLYVADIRTDDPAVRKLDVVLSRDDAMPASKRVSLDGEVNEAVLSPDGQTVAMIARGEVLVRHTGEDRPARRVTRTAARERDLAWSPDNRVLYFASDDGSGYDIHRAAVSLSKVDLEEADDEADEPAEDETGDEARDDDGAANDGADGEQPEEPTAGERWAEALTFDIVPVTTAQADDRYPRPSPDGRGLLVTRGLGELVHIDLESAEENEILEGWNLGDVAWAGDSRHIVFERSDLDFNSDIFLLDAVAAAQGESAEAINITQHPDNDFSPRLSRDGKVLYFLSERAGQNWSFDVHRVFLDETLDRLSDYELDEHFEKAAKAMADAEPIAPPGEREEGAAAEPMDFDADEAFMRIERITSFPASEGNLAITPAGDRVLFTTEIAGDTALHAVDFRGEDRTQLHGGGVSAVSVDLTGEKAAFVKGGLAHAVPIAGGDTETFSFDDDAQIDTEAEQRQKFLEAARTFGDTFYHPSMKGLDWDALTERYLPLAASTRTSQAFNRVVEMLFGEVDGSHTGIRGGDDYDAPDPDTGSLGALVEPAGDGYRVTDVLADGPADLDGGRGLAVGDVILSINGEPLVSPQNNAGLIDFDAALAGTAGEELVVEIRREGEAAGDETQHVVIEAIGVGAERNLRYRAEVERRRAEVERLSGGRLGYLHIRSMSEPSVRRFERDLFAAASGKDGLLIDVRDNGGGWTTDILLASLTAPRHAYTVPRGAERDVSAENWHYPRDRRLIYAYQEPIAVLCNQNSFSNAEIFSHAIKNTGRGILVGQQTYGGVISTGGFRLIDGTFVRQPFRGWYLPDGRDMENNGAMPDVVVAQTPDAEAKRRDPQLERAVEALLTRIEASPTQAAAGTATETNDG